MTAKHVLLWSPGGAGMHYHGPGTFMFRMYGRRDPDQLRVSLVHGSDRQEVYPDAFESQVFLPGLRSGPLPLLPSALSSLDEYRQKSIFVRAGLKWLDAYARQFDVFHGATNYSSSLVPALHASKLGVPACTTVMNLCGELVDQSALRRGLGVSERRIALISRLEAVIALSREIEQRLLEGGVPEEKVVYIPNCVDPALFGPAASASEKRALRNEMGLGSEPVIAYVGELTKRKRAHLLFQALSELHDFRGQWQVLLAGPANDASYARDLEIFVRDQGWQNQVHFLGHVCDIHRVYKAADFFCLPSEDEGMPGALLEAMVSQLPCIVTPFSSAHELIGNGVAAGQIVPPTSAAVASALRDYLGDTGLREDHGAAAREIVLARFSTKKILSDHLDLFDRLRTGRDPRSD